MSQPAMTSVGRFLAAALAASLGGIATAQNIIVNGDFEDGPPAWGFGTYYGGSFELPHWQVTGNSIDHIFNYWQAASGDRSLDLNGTAAGGVQQSLATSPGVVYVVTFAMAANAAGGPAVKTMKVRAGSQVSDNFSFDGSGTSTTDMRWSARLWQFVAADDVTELEFFSTVTDGPYGPALDDVRVEACIGAVVDPMVTACRGTPVPVEAHVAGDAPIAIRWQVEDASAVDDWRDLDEGSLFLDGVEWGVVSRTTDATLTVTADPVGSAAMPQIRLRARLANACGTATTLPGTLATCQCLECPADFNQDGGIDGGDINAFFAAWESGICDADVNADGGVDSGDVNAFFIAWESGGC